MTTRTCLFLACALFFSTPLLLVAGFGEYLSARARHQQLEGSLRSASASLRDQVATTVAIATNHALFSLAEANRDVFSAIQHNVESGTLTTDEARWLAAETLSAQKIGQRGYLFAYDNKGMIRIHPDGSRIATPVQPPLSSEEQKRICADRRSAAQARPPAAITPYRAAFPPWGWTIAAVPDPCEQEKNLPLEVVREALRRFGDTPGLTPFLIDASGTFWQPLPPAPTSQADLSAEYATIAETIGQRDHGLLTVQPAPHKDQPPASLLLAFHRLPGQGLAVGVYTDTKKAAILPRQPTSDGLTLPILLAATLWILVAAFGFSHALATRLRRFHAAIAAAESQQAGLNLTGIRTEEFLQVGGMFNRVLLQLRQAREQLDRQQEASDGVTTQLQREIHNRQEAQQKLLAEITTRKSAENYLLLFKNIFDNAIEGIFITDWMARILTVNHAFTEVTGFQEDEAVGNNPRFLSSGRKGDDSFQRMWQQLKARGSWAGEIWFKFRDGTISPQWLSISEIKDDGGKTTHYFAFFHDISELKKKEQQISFMAYRDRLTKLPNRAALEGRLAKAISRAARDRLTLAIFFIDLDNFKNINDSLGHDKGDLVLVTVAERLSRIIRSEDTLSRLGGDEFILLSENIENESAIFNLASRILDSFKQPMVIGPSTIYINASIGISIYPDDGQTPQTLIKNADMAMYKAKSEGKNKFVLFTQEMNEKLLARIRIENAIRIGLAKREFVVYYQPKIDLLTEATTSYEALVRWLQDGVIVGPNEFIPIAEDSGLIDEMSLYVLREVCLFLRRLIDEGLPALPVSVNMSPRTFNNLEIVEIVDSILESHHIDHRHIEFEITESTAMQDVQHTLATMRRFRQRGIRFSIDDFGTGYSSLSYLSEMPVSTLKIDKRFIAADDPNSRSIVSAITAIAKQMQLKVVAEGVETRDQMLWLRQLGCTEAQGYYYAKPQPEDEAIARLRTTLAPVPKR